MWIPNSQIRILDLGTQIHNLRTNIMIWKPWIWIPRPRRWVPNPGFAYPCLGLKSQTQLPLLPPGFAGALTGAIEDHPGP